MTASTIECVGVVGGGIMGAGIAEVAARAGLDVVLVETDDDAVVRARQRVEKSLARAAERGKVEHEEAAAALAALDTTTEYAALADRQLVVEAVVEEKSAKLEVFARLAEVV